MKILKISEYINESISKNNRQPIIERGIKVKMPLPDDIMQIYTLFKASNKDLYVVGGSVRDFILGKVAHDIDLVTDALPDESKNILSGWNISDEQGKNFGVIRIYTKDCPLGYELAVFRRDISTGRDTKGDDAKVDFGKHVTIEDDVKRRDFTQNALFYDIGKQEIVDLVGGYSDIKNNIIRAVGDPAQRFNEDRLRILRGIRFSARSHSKLDDATAAAIKTDNRLRGISATEDVSQERIVEEFKKMSDYCISLNDKKAWVDYLNFLAKFDLFEQMFPNVKVSKKVQNNDSINYLISLTLLFLENSPTNLFSDTLTLKIKFPREISNTIIFLLTYFLNNDKIEGSFDLKNLQNRYHVSSDTILDFVDVMKMDRIFADAFIKYDVTVDGNDLMKSGFKNSDVGKEKKRRELELFVKLISERYDF